MSPKNANPGWLEVLFATMRLAVLVVLMFFICPPSEDAGGFSFPVQSTKGAVYPGHLITATLNTTVFGCTLRRKLPFSTALAVGRRCHRTLPKGMTW